MSEFKAVPGLCYELQSDMDIDTTILDISSSKIVECLEGRHTYFIVSNGASCEYIKVSGVNGSLVITERGVDWTEPGNFSKGDKVVFDWIGPAMEDLLECLETDDEDEQPPPKIPGMTAVKDEATGQWCYEQDDEDITWNSGKYTYTFKNGKVTRQEREGISLQPGCFENAKITLSDDCEIVQIEEGNKPLYTPSVSDKCCPKTEE